MVSGKMLAAMAVLALAAAPVAQAQTAAETCRAIKGAMALTSQQLVELRGAVQASDDDDKTVYASKLQPPGYSGCKLTVDDDTDPYVQTHLDCDREFADTEASLEYLAGAYACLKDGFSEREAAESFIDGAWRLVEFMGEWTEGAPTAHAAYGDNDYANLSVESLFGGSEETSLDIWFYHLPE